MEEFQAGGLTAEASRDIRKIFSRIGLALTADILIVSGLQFLIGFVCSSYFPAATESGWYVWTTSFLPQFLVGAPVCLFLLQSKKPQESFGGKLGAGKYVQIFIICISVMYIGNIIGALVTGALGAGNMIQTAVTGSNVWATLLFAVILAPIVEELIFRKAIISHLRKYGDKLAIFVSALLFAMIHGNFSQFFYAFGLGLLFGYVYARTGRLRYSIGLHMIINFLGSVVGVLILRTASNLGLGDPSLAADYKTVYEYLGPHIGLILALSLYAAAMFSLGIAGFVLLLVTRKQAIFSAGTAAIPKGVRGKLIFGNVGMICYIVACVALFAFSLFAAK